MLLGSDEDTYRGKAGKKPEIERERGREGGRIQERWPSRGESYVKKIKLQNHYIVYVHGTSGQERWPRSCGEKGSTVANQYDYTSEAN